MEVILKETIETLGEEGDIVKVKPGYARNYLFPANKALFSTNVISQNTCLLSQVLRFLFFLSYLLFQIVHGLFCFWPFFYVTKLLF